MTVASDDPALRRRVIGSAAAAGTCLADETGPPGVEEMLIEGYGRPESIWRVAYRREGNPPGDLVYGTTVDSRATTAFLREAHAAPPADATCPAQGLSHEWLSLEVTGT